MLNDILKSKLDILAQDSVILDALKMLFNNRIEEERPKVSPDDDSSIRAGSLKALGASVEDGPASGGVEDGSRGAGDAQGCRA